jgi:peroxiredoxin
MKTSLVPALVLLLAGCTSSPGAGKMAPDFKLKTVDGKEVSLAENRGKGVLLAFWAVGCGPCQLEVPALKRLAETYGARGLSVLAVNYWNEPAATVREWAMEKEINYTVLLNGGKTGRDYGVKGIPSSFFIDPNGLITHVEVGYSPGSEAQLEERVKAILPAR